jgi:hypothetical protein
MVGMLRMRGRRVAAWLVSFPLMVVGSQVAHVFAYRWVYPNAHVRLSELLATGHSYMGSPSYAPMLLGFVFASELVAAGCVLVGALRRSRQRAVPAWAFALLPMLGFTLQEFIERWLSGSPFPWWMVLQPTYRVGLLLQLPFALVAYLVARLLLRAADRVGRILRGAVARPALIRVSLRWVVLEVDRPRRRVLASGRSGRGPPLTAAAVSALAS